MHGLQLTLLNGRRLLAAAAAFITLFGYFSAAMGTSAAWAADEPLPACLKGKVPLAIDNEQVLNWKKSTKNQYLDRGFVSGVVVDVYQDRNSHDHFEIMIGKDRSEILEVVYNKSFGALPPIRVGMRVEACGDYITSNQPTAKYPKPSPAGAIIHWVHMNPSGGHEDGFLRIDGKLYGHRVGGAVRTEPQPVKAPGKKSKKKPRKQPANQPMKAA
jgi:hypothetical protein